MLFEWDKKKNIANQKKHLISFEEASAVFERPILKARDDKKDYGEVRYLVHGELTLEKSDIVVVLVTTMRGKKVRIIRLVWPIEKRDKIIMPTSAKERHKKLIALKDGDINYSDIPPTENEFWDKAEVVLPKVKKAISLRVDEEILEFFKKRWPRLPDTNAGRAKSLYECKACREVTVSLK